GGGVARPPTPSPGPPRRGRTPPPPPRPPPRPPGGGGGGGVPFVCDVTQWLGKLPGGGFGEAETGATLIATAHKFGGPKGTGFIKLPADDPGFRLQPGGSQEHDHRGGTEDLPSIAALVAALADAEQQKVFLESDRLRLRDTAERALLAAVPGARIIAAGADRLWNTILLLLPFGENTRWVTRLDKRDVQVSTGSACATGKTGPSHVLTALGLTPDEARRSLRISSGWETTEADWQTLAAALAEVAAELWQP
ncbi:MAG: aminotransferase class V-fold PLP-dependent enzyme, partial [Opitutaceae bacterium]|nr:aminotransferase class V-fold PLP-dependent enzyme [Opitutaceae bacterium]